MIRCFSGFVALLGLTAALLSIGCNGAPAPDAAVPGSADQHAADHEHEHEHPSEGPHHGHLIELGEEEYHAELTHDDATKTVTIYLLGKDAKTAVPISDPEVVLNLVVAGKPQQVKLTAAPQEGDPQEQASRFTVVDEAALEVLEAPQTTGRLNVAIAGKPYSGAIEHHEHHDHKE